MQGRRKGQVKHCQKPTKGPLKGVKTDWACDRDERNTDGCESTTPLKSHLRRTCSRAESEKRQASSFCCASAPWPFQLKFELSYHTTCWCSGPWVLLLHDMAHSHVAGVCQQHLDDKRIDATDQPTRFQDLNTSGTSGTSGISSCHVTLRTVEELNDALIQVWEEIPQKTTHCCELF